ncbi:hypothetical protein ABZV14_17360 [Streptosporangium canum]|uniref:hypothetical protein n=1 Tax=Streptosporangium canum TaxID=324952 RepID=UPI00339DFBA7
MFAFALVSGVISEAFILQTFWNPTWEGLRIHDYGLIPALGAAPPWIMLQVGVRAVWSMSVPIAIAESMAGPRKENQQFRDGAGVVEQAVHCRPPPPGRRCADALPSGARRGCGPSCTG